MKLGKVVKRIRVPMRQPIRIKKKNDAPIPVRIPERTSVPVKGNYTP